MTYYSSTPTTVAPATVLGGSDLGAHQQDRLAPCGDAHDPYLARYSALPHVAPDYVEGLGLAVHEHGKRCYRLRMEQQA